jgi:hypothetical protein
MMETDAAILMEEIVESVKRGECILFIGAGVHYGPPEGSPYRYEPAERPPLGNALAEHLARESRFLQYFPNDNARNLQRVALHFEKITHNRERLVAEIKREVYEGKRPSPIVRALAHLKFPLVVTTNYDRLFERALQAADKEPVVSVYSKKENEKPREYSGLPEASRPFLFKIHGDVDSAEDIVITDEDYIQFILRMSDKNSPIPMTFRYHFSLWPTLFIGYSLMDYNLRLLFKTLRWGVDAASLKASYSVDLYPDRLIRAVFQDQTKFVVQDVWNFVPELYRRVTGEEMPQ